MNTILETTNGPVIIRPSQPGDAMAFRELRLQALREHPVAFGADYTSGQADPPEKWEQRVRDGAGTGGDVLYLAEAQGELIGMTGMYRQSGVKLRHNGMIWGVYVQSVWRGTGVSAALLNGCIAYARTLGLRQLLLSVAAVNGAALRAYLRAGFRVYGVEPEVIFHDGQYYDELMMVHRLVP